MTTRMASCVAVLAVVPVLSMARSRAVSVSVSNQKVRPLPPRGAPADRNVRRTRGFAGSVGATTPRGLLGLTTPPRRGSCAVGSSSLRLSQDRSLSEPEAWVPLLRRVRCSRCSPLVSLAGFPDEGLCVGPARVRAKPAIPRASDRPTTWLQRDELWKVARN